MRQIACYVIAGMLVSFALLRAPAAAQGLSMADWEDTWFRLVIKTKEYCPDSEGLAKQTERNVHYLYISDWDDQDQSFTADLWSFDEDTQQWDSNTITIEYTSGQPTDFLCWYHESDGGFTGSLFRLRGKDHDGELAKRKLYFLSGFSWVEDDCGGVFKISSKWLKEAPSELPIFPSDRNRKRDFATLDPREVLSRLAEMPITTWSYRSEPPSVRHMGPTAQDFHAAFGLGGNERYIRRVDAYGVAMAAIQGLYKELRDRDALIQRLQAERLAQQARLKRLEDRLSRLEADCSGCPGAP